MVSKADDEDETDTGGERKFLAEKEKVCAACG